MNAVAVIPARYASTRLPGKPLLDICGKPLIQHVWETVSRARGLDEVVVATDDMRIAHAVQAFGGKVCDFPGLPVRLRQGARGRRLSCR